MHHIIEHTVDAETYPKILFIWFDVDVRSSASERVDEQDVDEPDDRSVLARLCQSREVDLVVVLKNLKIFGVVSGPEFKSVQRNVEIGIVQSFADRNAGSISVMAVRTVLRSLLFAFDRKSGVENVDLVRPDIVLAYRKLN